MSTRIKAVDHPAPYSPEVLAVFERQLTAGTRIHDPFAGTGERLGALADRLELWFTGTELEAPFIVDPRVTHDNACLDTYPAELACVACLRRRRGGARGCPDHRPVGFTIVTSPVYPNGIADHFEARETCRACAGTGVSNVGALEPTDPGGLARCEKCEGAGTRNHYRRTYRAARAKITGHDEVLHQDNQGRWGYRGTPLHSTARGMYWNIGRRAVTHWTAAERLLLNVSDFMAGPHVEPVVAGWAQLVMAAGWRVTRAHKVETARWRDGANREARMEFEVVLDCRRAEGDDE